MKTTSLALLLWLTTTPLLAQPMRFLAFGDSITVGLGDTNVDCPTSSFGGYPEELQSLLRTEGLDAEVINRGSCGERTPEGLTRVEEVLAENGDVLILMEGTNDISDGDVSVESIRFNLNEIADKVTAAGVGLVSTTLLPRGPEDRNRGRNTLLAENLRDDATTKGYVLADIHKTFTDIPDFFDTLFSNPLHPNPQGYDIMARAFVVPAQRAAANGGCVPGVCIEDENTLCLNDDRFQLTVDWERANGRMGVGKAVELTNDTGYFWFFNRTNVEMVVKVLDACSGTINKFWVFAGGLTNVGVVMRVVDTETCTSKTYTNPIDVAFQPIQDTSAFDTCPTG